VQDKFSRPVSISSNFLSWLSTNIFTASACYSLTRSLVAPSVDATLNTTILQGNVATHARVGGVFTYCITENLLLSVSVKIKNFIIFDEKNTSHLF